MHMLRLALTHQPASNVECVTSCEATINITTPPSHAGEATAEQRLGLLQAVTAVWAESSTVEAAASSILKHAGQALGWEFGALWIVDDETLRCVEVWSELGEASELLRLSLTTTFARGEGLPGGVWESQQPAWINDLRQNADFVRRHAAVSDGLLTGFAFPIVVDHGALAVIEFFRRQLTERDDALLAMMGPLGHQIGLFIERKRFEDSLRESELLYRTLAEASPLVVWIVEAGGNVTYINRRWLEYTGLPFPKAISHGWEGAVHPDDLKEFVDRRVSGRADEGFRVEVRFRRADGVYRWHLVEVVPIRHERALVPRWLGTAIDIDDQKAAALSLKSANELKDEFLGLVSHELRTPITTILGNAQILRRHIELITENDRRVAIADIEQEAARLERIIENMLLLARLETARDIELEPIDLQRTLPTLVQKSLRVDRGRTVHVLIDADCRFVLAVPTYFELVVHNLVTNADKYSRVGEPIHVAARRSGSAVHVTISDRGAGIDPDELDQLFSPFYRGARTSRHVNGLGVGLSVCRRVLQAQGGTIWARRRDGGGSEFSFSLPAADEDGKSES